MNFGATADVTLPRLTSPVGVRSWLLTGVLAAALLMALANAVTLTGTLVADDAGATAKAYHALLIFLGAAMLVRGRIPRPRSELLLYFAVTLSATLLAYAVYEPRVAGIKLLIALYAALIGASIGRVAGSRVVLRAARGASVLFLIAVTVKNAQHVPAFISYLARPLGHPEVPSLAGGGLNLEATWLALASFFLIGTSLFVPFALTALATSALYATRAGVVVTGLAVGAALAHAWFTRNQLPAGREGSSTFRIRVRRTATLLFACVAIVAATTAVRTVRQYGEVTYVAQRFTTIGEEPGSLGRMMLWRGGLRVFGEHPLGVGAGNAVPPTCRCRP